MKLRFAAIVLFAGVVVAAVLYGYHHRDPGVPPAPPKALDAAEQEAAIRKGCINCHPWTEPDILTKDTWPKIIEDMNELATSYLMNYDKPLVEGMAVEDVIRWFVERAPVSLPPPTLNARMGPGPIEFRRRTIELPDGELPAISNVRVVDVFPDPEPELAFTDMMSGKIFVMSPFDERPYQVAKLQSPSHVESADVDGDGRPDLLVADMGIPRPVDEPVGRILVLRGLGGLDFEPQVVLGDIGRASDARAVDLDLDGDLDIAAAAYGWRRIGSAYVLENVSKPGGPLAFESRVLAYDKIGPVSLVTGFDLAGTPAPDIAVLFAQHHENLSLFHDLGYWIYQEELVYRAPHPNWGNDNVEVVDLDGDGDLDFLLAHGDTLDDMLPFKPYHGVQWIENLGDLKWQDHWIGVLYGAHRALAADLDGDGDQDVVASSYLPQRGTGAFPGEPPSLSIAWYEQTPEGWIPWVIELDHNLHPTLAVIDYDQDGDPDVVAGTLDMRGADEGRKRVPALEVYENLGRR